MLYEKPLPVIVLYSSRNIAAHFVIVCIFDKILPYYVCLCTLVLIVFQNLTISLALIVWVRLIMVNSSWWMLTFMRSICILAVFAINHVVSAVIHISLILRMRIEVTALKIIHHHVVTWWLITWNVIKHIWSIAILNWIRLI